MICVFVMMDDAMIDAVMIDDAIIVVVLMDVSMLYGAEPGFK